MVERIEDNLLHDDHAITRQTRPRAGGKEIATAAPPNRYGKARPIPARHGTVRYDKGYEHRT